MVHWPIAWSLFFIFTLLSASHAQQSFWPAAVPLAVRSPYLNTWLRTDKGIQNPHLGWPMFWKLGNAVTAWMGYVRVDNKTWGILSPPGRPNIASRSVLESIAVTPTRTIIRVLCGPVALNMTFLTPIEPGDLVRQSFAYSFLYMDLESLDGNSHSIQFYTDITGEWLSSTKSTTVEWDTVATSDVVCHTLGRQSPLQAEEAEMSGDSTFYYAMLPSNNAKWQLGFATEMRDGFGTDGVVGGAQAGGSRNIDDGWPVAAFSVDIGQVTSTTEPVVWLIAQQHDTSVLYSPDGDSVEEYRPYWQTKYGADPISAIADFLKDFSGTRDRAIQLDDKIVTAARTISQHYADLVSLVARQTLAGMEITVAIMGDNPSKTKAFMKNMGFREAGTNTDGSGFNGSRMNPVETIYSAMPALLYFDPTHLGLLLEPLLVFQSSPSNSLPYAAADIGNTYPHAITSPQEHQQGVEQSANMLILSLAHARHSGDGSLLSRHYYLLKRWADYLSNNTLNPTSQLTADGLNQTNQANLAIKGIIGIKAMSEISNAVGKMDDYNTYTAVAQDLVGKWRTQATSDNHLVLEYQNPASNGLFYNLYVDKLLRTNLIPEGVYSNQASHYNSILQSARFGPGYDSSDPVIAKPHWTMFTAAALRNYSIMDTFIESIHNRASSNETVGLFPESYRVDTGDAVNGEASPMLGAMFAILALDLEQKHIEAPPITEVPSNDPTQTSPLLTVGAIVGIVFGVLAGVAVISFAIIFWCRRRNTNLLMEGDTEPVLVPYLITAPNPNDPSRSPKPPMISQNSLTKTATPMDNTQPLTSAPLFPSPARQGGSATQLIDELADIRRELNQMRADGVYPAPPPSYQTRLSNRLELGAQTTPVSDHWVIEA